MTAKTCTTVLTIAGSDGSGGAGIQADLKTISANNCYGVSVITAVTAQNTLGISAMHLVPAGMIASQLEAIISDIRIDAVKIGMMGSCEASETIQRHLETVNNTPVVLDTVLRSSSGAALFPEKEMASIKLLFPSVALITPNLPEAALLTGKERIPSQKDEIEQMAFELQQAGARSVLIKGGHGTDGFCNDCLLHEDSFSWFSNPKIVTTNTHGTGCTLSSAIATGLAKHYDMIDAVERAVAYTRESLIRGSAWRIGNGTGPLQHFPGSDWCQLSGKMHD
jgi:hydroxymethylpyrimidine/phosphomethylpyrimidine kinase